MPPVSVGAFRGCEQERAQYRRTLEKYESGKWRVGETDEAGRIVDRTAEEIANLKARLADLDRLLGS